MKRFSKMVSRTCEVPVAVHIKAMSWACRSVGKPGKGWVSTLTGREAATVPRDPDAGRALLDLDSGRTQRVERLAQEIWPRAVEQNVAAGDRGRHGVGSGLDAVGQNGMLGAVQGLAPLHP